MNTVASFQTNPHIAKLIIKKGKEEKKKRSSTYKTGSFVLRSDTVLAGC